MNVFEKVIGVVKTIQADLNLEEQDIYEITQKIANKFHYKTKKKVELNKREVMLYEFYINRNLNPSTMYKWMLLLKNASPDIRLKLERNQLSISGARRLIKQYKREHYITQQQFINTVADNVNRYKYFRS